MYLGGLIALVGVTPPPAQAASETFNFTQSFQTFPVPSGVDEVTFDVYGAQGGGSLGGEGAHVHATFATAPGETLRVYVGGTPDDASGGFNGGGSGNSGGGGASDVRRGPGYGLTDRLLVAGGGGGNGLGGEYFDGTGGQSYAEGPGGVSGAAGGIGGSPVGQATGGGGQAGTQSAGGSAGDNYTQPPATAGLLGTGGTGGGESNTSWGGGGGGGFFGGGGGGSGSFFGCPCGPGGFTQSNGAGGGGGGGSSFLPAGSGSVTEGVRTGDGLVSVSYEPSPLVTTGDPSGIGDNVASLAGSVNPRTNPTTYHFEYGTSTSYGQSTAESTAGDGSLDLPVSAPLAGLTPGTEYHYRIVGTTCGGCPAGTKSGADRTFTTTGVAPGGGASIRGPAKGRARLDRKGRFTVPGTTVDCPSGGGDCGVSAQATTSQKRSTRRAGPLASTTFTIRPGGSSTLKLKLKKKKVKQVRRAKKLATSVAITATQGSASSSKTVAVKLKPPKKKRS